MFEQKKGYEEKFEGVSESCRGMLIALATTLTAEVEELAHISQLEKPVLERAIQEAQDIGLVVEVTTWPGRPEFDPRQGKMVTKEVVLKERQWKLEEGFRDWFKKKFDL